ncbi:MAG: AbrB/MazE/SpoVT family DNA-binding domain-containing protein [Hyphomicrobiales bacterium]|nr:AbrB/MazE/SpoVT family DNA-binding domain-containing protein [Hyphomicrobiales bacterium]
MALAKSSTTVLSTKGQVIIPKAVRDQKNWAPGERLVVESTPEGVLLRQERLFPATQFEEVRGCLAPKRKKALSLDEIDAALRAAAKRRYARG